jgi:hypothetical protein
LELLAISGQFSPFYARQKNLTNSKYQRSNTKKQSTENEYDNEIPKVPEHKMLVHIKTFDVTIDHIFFHFIGSKLGLYVSFRIRLYHPDS